MVREHDTVEANPSDPAWSGALAAVQMRGDVSRFFIDLRRALGVSPTRISEQLKTNVRVISALERADVEALPPWQETGRIVMSYTAWAGIDGRPVLTALATLLRDVEHRNRSAAQFAAVRPAVSASAARLRHASQIIAEGARRLPREALNQARERPARTFYALSLPLGLLILSLNSGLAQTLAANMPRPLVEAATFVKDALAAQFPPVHEGLRWIEVEDPRSRRSDKLPVAGT